MSIYGEPEMRSSLGPSIDPVPSSRVPTYRDRLRATLIAGALITLASLLLILVGWQYGIGDGHWVLSAAFAGGLLVIALIVQAKYRRLHREGGRYLDCDHCGSKLGYQPWDFTDHGPVHVGCLQPMYDLEERIRRNQHTANVNRWYHGALMHMSRLPTPSDAEPDLEPLSEASRIGSVATRWYDRLYDVSAYSLAMLTVFVLTTICFVGTLPAAPIQYVMMTTMVVSGFGHVGLQWRSMILRTR